MRRPRLLYSDRENLGGSSQQANSSDWQLGHQSSLVSEISVIVLPDNRKEATGIAWEHGGPDFQSRFDKSIGQAQKIEKVILRVL